jgi:ribosomal protein L10
VERAAKRELVSTLNDVFSTTSVVVVAHYAGLTVADMQKLRAQMKQAGATVKVAKNSLAKIALEGKDVASISGLMKGPTLIAYSNDPVAAPKVAVDFAKANDKLVILGGAMGTTAERGRSEGACHSAVPRRTARQAGRPHPGPGYQDRSAQHCAGGEARPRIRGLCQDRRSGVRP